MSRSILGIWAVVILLGLVLFPVRQLFSESEPILARVGDKVITQSDLDELIKRYETYRKGKPFTLKEKKDFLDGLVKNTIIVIEAEREKIDEKPEVQSKLKMLKHELLVEEYIATKVNPFVSIKDEEINEIMKNNPNLVPREMLTLKEITVKTEKEAEEIYKELKNGADFSRVVAEKSISRTKTKEGLIGTISRGQIPPPIETLVFSLKEGEFSKPIKGDEGFQIFYVESRKERSPQEIKMLEEKVREKIIQLEKNKKIEAMIGKKIEELKKQIKIETYSDRLK